MMMNPTTELCVTNKTVSPCIKGVPGLVPTRGGVRKITISPMPNQKSLESCSQHGTGVTSKPLTKTILRGVYTSNHWYKTSLRGADQRPAVRADRHWPYRKSINSKKNWQLSIFLP